MKRSRLIRPLCMVGVLLLAVLACLPGPTPLSTQPPVVQDTVAPVATTVPPTEAAQKYFTEEFDGEGDPWSHFVVDASVPGAMPALAPKDVENMSVGVNKGALVFDLQSKWLYVYAMYDSQEYEDVRLDAVAENSGVNDNNISLICRYSKEDGWYEFNVANNGLFDIYYARYTQDDKIVYGKLADGGSNKIKQGKDVNNYAITCKGRTLVLYINGFETRRIVDNQYVLKSGKVGVSVSSFKFLPVKVAFDSVKISEP